MDNCFQSETNDSYIHGYYKIYILWSA